MTTSTGPGGSPGAGRAQAAGPRHRASGRVLRGRLLSQGCSSFGRRQRMRLRGLRRQLGLRRQQNAVDSD